MVSDGGKRMMKKEDFIYDFIRLLMSWGAWNYPVIIYCDDKKYMPCEEPNISTKHFSYAEYEMLDKLFEEEKEKNTFRGLKNVRILDMDDEDKTFKSRWPEKCEMFIEFNGPLNNLFAYGVLRTELGDLPHERKEYAYYEYPELKEEFLELYDREDMKEYPEDYELPAEIEFDSTEEYEKFLDDEIYEYEREYIRDLGGYFSFGNELEEDISILVIDYGISYEFAGDGLYIGYGYF